MKMKNSFFLALFLLFGCSFSERMGVDLVRTAKDIGAVADDQYHRSCAALGEEGCHHHNYKQCIDEEGHLEMTCKSCGQIIRSPRPVRVLPPQNAPDGDFNAQPNDVTGGGTPAGLRDYNFGGVPGCKRILPLPSSDSRGTDSR